MTAGFVTGFGCRPITAIDTRTTGPAFESRQGRKTRAVGHPAQRALWGIGRHCACSRGPVQRASTPRMRGVGAMVGQTSIENTGSEALRGLLHVSDRD